MRNNSNLFAPTSWVSGFKNAIYPWSSDLDPQIIQAIRANIDIRTFYHVTPKSNWNSIKEHGLLAEHGGGSSGLSYHCEEYQDSCRQYIHLGRNDFPLPGFMPFSHITDPRKFYHMAFKQQHIEAMTITVILPKEANKKIPEKKCKLNTELSQLPSIFQPPKKLLPLIAEGFIEKDNADQLPGRYKTLIDFPPSHLFGESLADSLKKNEVKNDVIDTLVPEDLTKDKKREYLYAACGVSLTS